MTDHSAPAPATLIYLDVDDEITSAAARIRLAAAERVALVLPYSSRLATSRINFRLLAREAVERGKQIEIICADASARALAQAAGLPVHASVAAFEGRGPEAGSSATGGAAGGASGMDPGANAGRPEPEDDDTQTRVIATPRKRAPKVPIVGPPRPPIRTGVAVAIGLAVVLLVLVGGLLGAELLPSATIVLHPRSEPVGPLDLTIEARPDAVAVDAENLVIPAQRLTFDVSATQSFTATGTKVINTKATGNVTFSNFDTGRGVVIPSGTVVQTDTKTQFRTLADITLPRAQYDLFPPFATHPSTGSVGVEAVEAGPDGNVGNNTITDVVKGGRNLFVTNKEATSGGESRQATEVSQADVDAAVAAIEAGLLADLDAQVAAGTGVPAGVTPFPETKALGEATYATDPTTLVGTEATEFSLEATAEGTVIAVDQKPVGEIAEARIRSRVTAGWTLVETSIQPTIGTPSVLGEVVRFPVTISATQTHDVDQAALIAQIKGLLLADARNRLDDYGDVDITLWPDWVDKVPTRTDRITFTVGDPQPSAAPSPASSNAAP